MTLALSIAFDVNLTWASTPLFLRLSKSGSFALLYKGRNTRIKATDFSKVSKFWKGLVNFHKVMVISWFLFLFAIMQYSVLGLQ